MFMFTNKTWKHNDQNTIIVRYFGQIFKIYKTHIINYKIIILENIKKQELKMRTQNEPIYNKVVTKSNLETQEMWS